MIIADTNVVSDPLSPSPDLRVINWLDRQLAEDVFITSITIAEMTAGMELLPQGRRRQDLKNAIEQIIEVQFASRILSFDPPAAREYGVLFARLQRQGMNCKMADIQIAAIAQCHGASVATRDVKPFRAAGIRVINPWTDE